MSQDTDIQNLFRQFDGTPSQYKEIARTEQSLGARQRWPLLDAIRLHQDPVPPAKIAETFRSALNARSQVPSVPVVDFAMPDEAVALQKTVLQPKAAVPASMVAQMSPTIEPSKTSWFRSVAPSAMPPAPAIREPAPTLSAMVGSTQASRLFSARQPLEGHENTQTVATETASASSPQRAVPPFIVGATGPIPPTKAPAAAAQNGQTPLKSLFNRLASSSDTPLRRG